MNADLDYIKLKLDWEEMEEEFYEAISKFVTPGAER